MMTILLGLNPTSKSKKRYSQIEERFVKIGLTKSYCLFLPSFSIISLTNFLSST